MRAFQLFAFQDNAFQVGMGITSTIDIQLPIDCVMAGDQPLKERINEYEIRPQNRKYRTSISRSGVSRLDNKPTFTTHTSKRGYD